MDAADEAGGEVIYSYDGEDPVPVPKAPLSSSTGAGSVHTDGPTAPQAFESFAGKIYPSSTTSFVGAFGAAKEESALERLGRLQHEIAQLEQDLTTGVASSNKQGSGADAASGEQSFGDNDDLEEEDATLGLIMNVQQLKVRLARVGVIPPQETLTQNVQQAASHLQQQQASTPSKKGTTPTSGLTPSETAAASSALEARLQRLEAWIGSSGASATDTSLQERLTQLESTFAKWDDKELDAKAKKAKVIRQDLEAASKARHKLMAGSASASGGGGATTASDAKVLTQLHDQLVQLHGLTPFLPMLVQRLQALSRQHQEAALQHQQLQAVQDLAVKVLEPQVQQLETALKNTQDHLNTTSEQMLANLKALDEKLENTTT